MIKQLQDMIIDCHIEIAILFLNITSEKLTSHIRIFEFHLKRKRSSYNLKTLEGAVLNFCHLFKKNQSTPYII